ELETIVLKAMAKNPEERYASAGELADDLRRFLDDQPVRARRPGLGVRAAKWARRHRRVVTAAVLGAGAAVVGLGVCNWHVSGAEAQARAANDDLHAVNLELKKEKKRLEREKRRTAAALEQERVQRGRAAAALEREVVERDRAESNYRAAREVLDFLTQL